MTENIPNINNGRVVNNPANVFEMLKSIRMLLINGPTAVKEGRKLNATKMIPRKNIMLRKDIRCFFDEFILKKFN